jgi:serine/threonine protein kinase
MPMRRIVSLKVLDWWRGEPADMPRDPAALDEAIDDAYASTLALDAPSTLERWRAPPTPCPAPRAKKVTPPKKTPLVKQAKRYASRFFKPEMSRQPFVPDDLEVLREVGRGAFGRVYVSRVKGGGGALFAVKVLRKAEVLRGGGAECAFTERALGADLRHAGVVRLRCAFQTKKALYLVSDYYPGGSLCELRRPLSVDQVRFYGAEVAAALAHIHARGVVHRDLKPANILLDREGHCALADFGVATTGTLRGFRGTVAYMAPELLLKTANSATESDWWAFGCCLYELVTGKTPFYADQPRELFRKILHAPFIQTNTDDALDLLLEHLLDKQPASRAADSDVATCAFFSSVDWDEAASKRLTPPIQPPLPNYVEASQDGSLRFVGDAYRPKKNLPTPKRVTFDEENESPFAKRLSVRETYQREKRHRRTFRGFALNAEVDLAASPRTFARTTTL